MRKETLWDAEWGSREMQLEACSITLAPNPGPGWSRPERAEGWPGRLRKQLVTHTPWGQSLGSEGRDRHTGQGDRVQPRQGPLYPPSAGS